MSYQEGDFLTDRAEQTHWRVHIKGETTTWLFDVSNSARTLPIARSTSKLEDQLHEGELRKQAPKSGGRRTPGMSQYGRDVVQRLAPVLDDQLALMTDAGRGAAFGRLCQSDEKLTYKTFLKLLRAYFAGGGASDAIRSAWDRCGPKPIDHSNLHEVSLAEAIRICKSQANDIDLSKAKPPTDEELAMTKAGKPRKRLPPMKKTLYEVDRSTLRVFKKYFELLGKKTGYSLTKAYADMCLEVFSSLDALGNQVHWDLRRIPSFRQFDDWYRTLYNFKQRRLHRVLEGEYNKNEREVLGSEYSVAINAGAIGSGDATIWNVGLRSRMATREVVGPAVVFRIRDKRTGMLLGLAVSFDPASFAGFATAIANCFEDKIAFCAKYGIHIQREDWPVCGLPTSGFEADCGETDNKKPNRFIEATGVGFKNITAGRPDMKGGVEGDFRTLQVSMNGDAPGALIQRWQAAVKEEWRVKATMDVDEFMQMLLRLELLKMKSLRPDLRLPAEMTAAGVDTSPLSMWRWHVANRGGGLRSVDPVAATLSLMDEDSASITENGIYFKGVYYLADSLVANHSFAAVRRQGAPSVRVVYDSRLVDHIYIWELGTDPIKCRLNMRLEWQHDFPGKSFAEIRRLDATEAEVAASRAQDMHQASLETRAAVKDLIAESERKTKAASAVHSSPHAQMKGLKKARQRERDAQSPSQALVPPMPAPSTIAPSTENVVSLARPRPTRPGIGSMFASVVSAMNKGKADA